MVSNEANVRIHNKLEGLTEAWDTLGTTRESPMQHFIWSRACAETFRAAGQLQFFSVGSDDDLMALAPLVKRNGIFSRLEMIGVRELYEPMDFLYSEPSSLDVLARKLVKQGAAILLQRMPADSPAITAIQRAFRRRGLVHILPVDPYPYIELNSEWMAPENCFNAGRRSDFRRAQRQAAQFGEVKYEVLAPAPAEVDSLLEEAFQIELASWKGEAGTALAVDPVRGAFYRHYALAASERGILRLVFLRIDGQSAGMQIAIESNDRFWLLKIGHDNRFSKCSPGTLLMLHSLRYAATCGLRSYEFLGINEPWTRNWTDLSRSCVALRAYPFSPSGLAVISSDAAHFLLARMKRFLERKGGEK
ncbi:MAG: GNAT family N-acetyltransferase [Blastocatellia bacterium]|nr:GNAT family N-acetyltransferase [Blastocatellia bacterium]